MASFVSKAGGGCELVTAARNVKLLRLFGDGKEEHIYNEQRARPCANDAAA